MIVYKYELQFDPLGFANVDLPIGAKVLRADHQSVKAYIWVLLKDPEADHETRKFLLVGTGHPIPSGTKVKFLNTFFNEDHNFVFHMFEVVS